MGYERKTHCEIHNCERRFRPMNNEKGWYRSECPVCSRERKYRCYLRRKASHPDWTGYQRETKRRYRAMRIGRPCRRWLRQATWAQRKVVGPWA